MREQYYLCRVPSSDMVIVLREEDYKYQRNHEDRLRVPDPDNNVVLLAQGGWKEMRLYQDLIIGKGTNKC
jgi:hypothetical protein